MSAPRRADFRDSWDFGNGLRLCRVRGEESIEVSLDNGEARFAFTRHELQAFLDRNFGTHRLTDEQVKYIRAIGPESVWRIPNGSYLLVKNVRPGTVERIDVCEPGGHGTFAWDFGPEGA